MVFTCRLGIFGRALYSISHHIKPNFLWTVDPGQQFGNSRTYQAERTTKPSSMISLCLVTPRVITRTGFSTLTLGLPRVVNAHSQPRLVRTPSMCAFGTITVIPQPNPLPGTSSLCMKIRHLPASQTRVARAAMVLAKPLTWQTIYWLRMSTSAWTSVMPPGDRLRWRLNHQLIQPRPPSLISPQTVTIIMISWWMMPQPVLSTMGIMIL